MNTYQPIFRRTRRTFLGALTFTAAGFMVPGAFAEELARTPRVEEGPFYPYHLPLDTDNDLLVVNDSLTPAVGEVTHLSGRLLDSRGDPIRNAMIEIWQVDHAGIYYRDRPAHPGKFDANFQGFGRFLTGSTGEYYFRTIKPVAYGGRTPHVHFAVKLKGREKWTTQLFIKGCPSNDRDFLYRELRDPNARESVTADFEPIKGSRIGELAARFDIVMGFTPEA